MTGSGTQVGGADEMAEGLARTHRSTLLEKALEYRFLADLTAELLGRACGFEVLRTDVDRDGYDLVVEANRTMRHIQLKALVAGGRRGSVTVSTSLALKPSPCVVWMVYDPATLTPVSFRWFGGFPGSAMPPLGDQVARHTRANALGFKAQRAQHRVVAANRFARVATVSDLADRLFGSADPLHMLRRHIAGRAEGSGPDWLDRVRHGHSTAIPEGLGWDGSAELALLVDGYALLGSGRTDDADAYLESQIAHARTGGFWRGGPVELWTTLFIEHRRWRFSSPFEPQPDHVVLLDHLVSQLRAALTSVQASDTQSWSESPDL